MNREDIYALIEKERAEQDVKWPRNVAVNPNRAQYRFFAPHILVLEQKLANLRTAWYGSDKETLRQDFVKIATIAVRALEEVE